MRLPNKVSRWAVALGMTTALAGCGFFSGGESPSVSRADPAVATAAIGTGPEADYPVVLGDPFKIDGVEYKPDNSWNYDSVGYATVDPEVGVSGSHKTLPLPSYVEVTSLESGKTILVRVERRGPMTNAREIGLSVGAQNQLGTGEGTPVRVRRVNPPENDRAALRSGGPAPTRIDTPNSLVQVLRRKLPVSGSASLASGRSQQPAARPAAAPSPRPTATATAAPARSAAQTAAATPPQTPAAAPAPQPAAPGRFAVQAAAFSVKANATRAAKALGGFVQSSGGYHRVRTGPYANRGQAEAALAKVRAAGYSDAQVVTAG